jgi:hypothetical protein
MSDRHGDIQSAGQLVSAGRVTEQQRRTARTVIEQWGMPADDVREVLEALGLAKAPKLGQRAVNDIHCSVVCPTCGTQPGRRCPGKTHLARKQAAAEVSGG